MDRRATKYLKLRPFLLSTAAFSTDMGFRNSVPPGRGPEPYHYSVSFVSIAGLNTRRRLYTLTEVCTLGKAFFASTKNGNGNKIAALTSVKVC